MRDITIQPLSIDNQADLNRCDSYFVVEAELSLRAEDGRISYSIRPVAPWTKRYAPDQKAVDYVERPGRAAWLAYVDSSIAGQILVQEHLNRFAYVWDFAVDPPFRRQGIGRRLMQEAIVWARERRLAGVMVETQNINVPACRFYESCGFVLRGFDAYLYRGFDRDTQEIALFYYLSF
jgi:ribosomal protein S18 acetylase RimI-like enzyme